MAKNQETIVIKTYKGNQAAAATAFRYDAEAMEARGYYPTSQTWAPGSYGCFAFIVALILCVVLIGILIFIYMVIVKPAGTLTVTYELRAPNESSTAILPVEEKTCPKCAERVKAAAVICRFCGHGFGNPG